jgi:hypothetical protein
MLNHVRAGVLASAAGVFIGGLTTALAVDLPATELVPIVPGDVETRSTPFLAWVFDLEPDGYVEEEYLVSGGANIYAYVDDVAQRPEVEVLNADVPYTTRILVRRPADPAAFNGTVYVDILNATAGWDGDAIWYGNYEYFIRDGAIWVGMSTKPVTVNFLRDSWGRPPWPTRNASRYASLAMPAFGQVWDMLTELGALLKTPDATDNPLAGFDVQRLVMVGYSQSASYQVTYANSFHDAATLADGTSIYDGYYVSAGGASAKHVTGPSTTIESLPRGDARNLIRVDTPVVRFQTQTEVVNFPAWPVRQSEADYPLLRFYEMAGGSHVDANLNAVGGLALERDLGLPPSFCPAPAIPYNPIRIGYVQSAVLEALENWIAVGATPPASRFMELTNEGGVTALARDADGNVIGGVRPPQIEVPLGTYVESNAGPGFCGLYGGFAPFDEEEVRLRYRNHGGYVSRYTQEVRRSVAEGFLLLEDAAAQRRSAAESEIAK